MSKLRLGPIVEEKPVKVTLELSGRLFRDLSDYASAHARETGLAEPLPLDRIAPAMLERFIAADRGFTKSRQRG